MYHTRIRIDVVTLHIGIRMRFTHCQQEKFVNWVPEDQESETLTNVP
jgi:hypothetical protein